MNSSSFDLLASILVEEFKIAPERVVPDNTFSDLGLDSLELLEVSVFVQEHIDIFVDGITTESTLAEAVNLLTFLQTTGDASNTVHGKGKLACDPTT
ncbi:acyl carrier protein [Streptomyces netropsis]|uniref:acyl carrier protein n=1 Tax=Streptomyces netropsis TaxID=55404 RepID=UPI003798AE12